MADVLSPVIGQAAGCAAEQASLLILLQDDPISIQIDLQRVSFLNIQGAAKLNRKHNSTQFIYFSNNSCCFHNYRFLPIG